ncbi:MAG: transketolase [Actinomycetota bacterium]|nr:transketolase [Actinomycetota bacterium]
MDHDIADVLGNQNKTKRSYLVNDLKEIAKLLRTDALTMIHTAKSGHPGGSLSAADIIAVLYFHFLNIDPKNPKWTDRDRFIMSKGHACPIWYAALAEKGYFDKSNLSTLRKIDSILQGHPDMNKTPGIDMTTGSLGNGLGAGVGMALAARVLKKSYYTYILLGCGELNEGVLWEAAMSASKFKLDNLIAILDYNKLQLDGTNDEIMPTEPVADKWLSFNWHVQRINGHDIGKIIDSINIAKDVKGVPSIIIADTIKGKGVSFMENVCDWHGKAPDDSQYVEAIRQIQKN